ncbi:MAG: two component, sigma54 specific, transcriptional regulator, Fis family [Deferribacteraceae bacterium]|jgi:two-component system NtrC family response regulator|nr:two component, sigma54 specific, transcriptional regulator, Fis family [Deferribacteraceae bacterium]
MKILLVEDNETLATLIKIMLEDEGFTIEHSNRGDKALELIVKKNYDIVITDIKLPGANGNDILNFILKNNLNSIVIIITAYGNIADAVNAIKAGAYDYIPKPFENEVLINTVKKAANFKKIENENMQLKDFVKNTFRPNLIGKSPKFKTVMNLIEKVAETDAPVLLYGESGTGKELFAKQIHYQSNRATKPFVAVNCAAIPENLFESELFGHKKGSFTGADRDKTGKIKNADKGTLFLDEIGEIPLDMQAKLLRFLQEGEIQPVGAGSLEYVNVRVIAATNKNLEILVEKGQFREDLYYRLNIFPITIPPLRERKEDIPELVDFFLKKYGYKHIQVDKDILAKLQNYDWPGNIRELENAVYRMAILAKDGRLTIDFLNKGTDNVKSCLTLNLPNDSFDILAFEKEIILKSLEKFNGNKSKAAEYLCIPRHVLLYRLEKYEIKDNY